MEYNLTYNICGFVFFVAQFIMNSATNRLPSRSNSVFKLFIISALLAITANTFAAWATPLIPIDRVFERNILSVIHLVLVNAISAVYYFFMISVTHDRIKFKLHHFFLLVIPFAYMIFIIITSPFTHFVFYFDELGIYHHGFGMKTLYYVNIYFICCSFSELIINRDKCSILELVSMLVTTLGITGVMIFQAYHPRYLLLGFASSIGMYLINLSMRNPREFIDHNTGVYNRLAFKEYFFFKQAKIENEYICLVHFSNFDAISKNYGTTKSYYLIRRLVTFFKLYTRTKYVFYLFHNSFVFICKTKEDAEDLLNKIYRYTSIPVKTSNELKLAENTKILFETELYILSNVADICHSYESQKTYKAYDAIIELLKYAVQVKTGNNIINLIDNEVISDFEASKKRQAAMHEAIKNSSFEVFLQPIYNLRTKSFTSAEALLRLKDENGIYIPPALFISDAEKDGSILQLGEIALRKTCEFILEAKLQEKGIEKVNVNLSMIQCMQKNIGNKLISIIDEYNIPKNMIRFEITESIMISDPEKLYSLMQELNNYGIDFALDDYGTGYSNTSVLFNFPFSEIKFDKSFLNSILVDKKHEIPLQHLMNMVKASKMLVLVEGVEEKETSDMIASFGGDLIQGFYYAKPMSLSDFRLPEVLD